MLLQLYPRVHRRYSLLPVFGPIVENFGAWLVNQGYSTDCIREHFCYMRRIARLLDERGVGSVAELTRAKLQACAPAQRLDDRRLAASVRLLERYFASETSLFGTQQLSRIDQRVAKYATYLNEVRGLAASTVAGHCATVAALLTDIGYESTPERLRTLMPRDIETFIRRSGSRLKRSSIQGMVAHVRTFLRFVASSGEASTGLDRQIDTPRVYREEKLPKSLPWETVQAFLRAIDRSTPSGIRDYAIFLLIATYGLRACDVVALALDDVAWRARRIRIQQRKTGRLLWLPLTDEVATALLEYLRRGRPHLCVRRFRRGFQRDHPNFREIFLRCKTPAGVLKSTAIAEIFQKWSRRSGLKIASQGVHCIRHSYALHLLRSGLPLKTIGDLLGHQTLESTCVYLRLATDDLRDVPLNLPAGASATGQHEVAR
jgi:site-specific recombinase XerD